MRKISTYAPTNTSVKNVRNVYQNLIDNFLPTNGRQVILPTRQRQLRPITKAKLEVDAQVEVWIDAIALAHGKIPSNSIVAQAVNLYLAKNNTQSNPFQKGEVCRIVVRGNSKLKGLGGSWCIVEEVSDRACLVNTWNNQLSIPSPSMFDDSSCIETSYSQAWLSFVIEKIESNYSEDNSYKTLKNRDDKHPSLSKFGFGYSVLTVKYG